MLVPAWPLAVLGLPQRLVCWSTFLSPGFARATFTSPFHGVALAGFHPALPVTHRTHQALASLPAAGCLKGNASGLMTVGMQIECRLAGDPSAPFDIKWGTEATGVALEGPSKASSYRSTSSKPHVTLYSPS